MNDNLPDDVTPGMIPDRTLDPRCEDCGAGYPACGMEPAECADTAALDRADELNDREADGW